MASTLTPFSRKWVVTLKHKMQCMHSDNTLKSYISVAIYVMADASPDHQSRLTLVEMGGVQVPGHIQHVWAQQTFLWGSLLLPDPMQFSQGPQGTLLPGGVARRHCMSID